jgi:hypothetical protein
MPYLFRHVRNWVHNMSVFSDVTRIVMFHYGADMDSIKEKYRNEYTKHHEYRGSTGDLFLDLKLKCDSYTRYFDVLAKLLNETKAVMKR